MDEEPRDESAFEQFEAQLMEEFTEKMEADEEEKEEELESQQFVII